MKIKKKILIFALINIFNLQFIFSNELITGCAYNVKDEASEEIYNKIKDVIKSDIDTINAIKASSAAEGCSINTDQINSAASMIQIISKELIPQKHSFESLMIGAQAIDCPATPSGFGSFLIDYIRYSTTSLENKAFPDDFSAISDYFQLEGDSATIIHGVFEECHTEISSGSRSLIDYRNCIQTKIFNEPVGHVTFQNVNSPAYSIWSQCAVQVANISEQLQPYVNQSDITALRQGNLANVLTNTYEVIEDTLNGLTNVDPKCPGYKNVSNIINTVVNGAVGLGQIVGAPYLSLALGLAAKPISKLVETISFNLSGHGKHLKDLNEISSFINGQDQNYKKYLCTNIEMQKLKCDTLKQLDDMDKTLAESCTAYNPQSTISTNSFVTNIENVQSFINENYSLKLDTPEKPVSEPNAPTVESPNLTKQVEIASISANNFLSSNNILLQGLENFNNDFFGANKNLKLYADGEESSNLSINEFISSFENYNGLSNSSFSDKMRFNKLKEYFLDLNKKAEVVKNTFEEYQKEQNDKIAGSVLKAVDEFQELSRNPTIPGNEKSYKELLIEFSTLYYENQASQSNNSAYQVAIQGLKGNTNNAINSLFSSNQLSTGYSLSERNNNINMYNDFMASKFSIDTILEPLIDKIDNSEINTAADDLSPNLTNSFYSTVYPAMRDCYFLYQSVIDTADVNLYEKYYKKCEPILKCSTYYNPNSIFSFFDPSGMKNSEIKAKLSNISQGFKHTKTYAGYQEVCAVNENFPFMVSAAQEHYTNNFSSLCPAPTK